jgi:hypothetical protein
LLNPPPPEQNSWVRHCTYIYIYHGLVVRPAYVPDKRGCK